MLVGPTFQFSIPAWPVLLPAAGTLGVLAWRRTRGGTQERLRAAALPWAVIAYGAAALSVTFFPVVVATGGTGIGLNLLGYVNLVPFVHAEPGAYLQNVLLTVPLGVLAPLCSGRIRTVHDAARVGLAASLVVESGQLLLDLLVHAGHIADVDDVTANVLGAALGFTLLERLAGPRPVTALRQWVRPVVGAPTRPGAASAGAGNDRA